MSDEVSKQLISFLSCLISNQVITIITFILFAIIIIIITKLFCEKSNLEMILDAMKNFNKDQGFILVIIVFIAYAFQEENVWLRGISIILIIALSAYLIKQRTDVDKVDKIKTTLAHQQENAENDEQRSILGGEQ